MAWHCENYGENNGITKTANVRLTGESSCEKAVAGGFSVPGLPVSEKRRRGEGGKC